ncbi:MAG: hypothetical protein HYT76_03970 [Deltaproteobacteria bacterium]|nr:hypothetical protein [Deltaproteobacteria bacterium]
MEQEISLSGYVRIALRYKKIIFGCVGFVTAASIIISLMLPKSFKALGTIYPVGGKSVGSFMSSAQMGLLGFLAGAGGANTSVNQILAVLKSRALAEKVIKKHDLLKILYPQYWNKKELRWKVAENELPGTEVAINLLLTKVSFKEDRKSQLVEIESEVENPELAAKLVNIYIEELADHIRESVFSSAKRNRIFIETQLARNNRDLLESGKELSDFYGAKKISNVDAKVDVDISTQEDFALLKEIGAPEIKEREEKADNSTIPSLLAGVSNAYAGIEKADELQQEVKKIDEKIKNARIVSDVPQQVYLQYLTYKRELLGQVNSLLTQQYEMAKIDETKEELNFQIIDWARIPTKKDKPNRMQFVIVFFFLSLILSLTYVFLKDYAESKMGKVSVRS